MNIEKNNKLQMYITVRMLLRSNAEVLTKLPNAEEYLMALDGVILDIENYNALREAGTKEIRQQFEKLKGALMDAILEDEGKLMAYASYKEDKLLMQLFKKSKRTLNGLYDLDLVQHAKSLHNKIEAILPELGKYYLSAESQARLLKLANDFERLSPEFNNAKCKHLQTGVATDECYTKANAIVAKLDTEMEIIRTSESAFYQRYKEVRKVVLNYDTNMVIGHILDSVTGKGLPNARVSLKLNDSASEPIEKISAKKGGLQIKTVTPGIYTVTVTKIGYVSQSISLTINGDNQIVFEMKLVRA